MTATQELPTIEQYLSEHPDADPQTMLQVLLQKNRSTQSQLEYLREEYRVSSEVELDASFQFKPKSLAQLQRLARMYAESGSVPDHYKNNIADTAISIQMALRCRVDIMTFLQSSYVVYGKPGIEGKLVIAMLNSSDAIDGRVKFEAKKDGNGKIIEMKATAIDAQTQDPVSAEVTWDMVVAEKWDQDKKGQKSKWVTLPEQMFKYRSAAFLARAHFPDVLFGMHTVDELEDIGAINGQSVNGTVETAQSSLAQLTERLGAKPGRKKAVKAAEEPDNEPDKPAETEQPPREESAPQTASKQPDNGKSSAKETASPQGSPKAEKKSQTIEGLLAYIDNRWEDESAKFDKQQLAAEALKSPNGMSFIDSVMTEKRLSWETFLLEVEGDEEKPAEPAPDKTVHPDFVTKPVPRPSSMGGMARTIEKTIFEKRSPEIIRDYAETQIDGHPDLSTAELSYLLSFAQRRAYQLQHNLPRTDKVE